MVFVEVIDNNGKLMTMEMDEHREFLLGETALAKANDYDTHGAHYPLLGWFSRLAHKPAAEPTVA